MSEPVDPGPGASAPSQTRTVVTDDGTKIRLVVYAAGVVEPLAVAELSPELAVLVAAELAAAAARNLHEQRNRRVGVQGGP